MKSQNKPRIRFSVIGLNHGHIYGQTRAVIGGELVSFYAREPELASSFSKQFPQARLARGEKEILEDRSIQLIVSASIPNERAPLGLAVMRHGGLGYIRIDWFTPDGLPTWGDTRLTVLGAEGYIEVRKNVDIGGSAGGDHLLLVDQKGVQRIDCRDVPLLYGQRLVTDILDRSETAMPQAHCFLATELALKAQKQAQRISGSQN